LSADAVATGSLNFTGSVALKGLATSPTLFNTAFHGAIKINAPEASLNYTYKGGPKQSLASVNMGTFLQVSVTFP
jgi:hypothetical protein